MSENFNQSPGEPENTGSQSEEPQEQQNQPAAEPNQAGPQPAAEEPASLPQYPPAPEYYAQPQQTSIDPYGGPPAYNPPPQGYVPPPVSYAPQVPERPSYGYEYPPLPPVRPLPLGQALRELPQQYKKILFKPGARSFAEEQGKADWGVIWLQLLFLVVFEAIIALPIGLMEGSMFSSLNTTTSVPIPSSAFVMAITISTIIFTPLIFFAGVGIQYLLARAFKGTGDFKTQAYNQLLYQVPTTFVLALLYLIMTPFLSGMTVVPTAANQVPTISPASLAVTLIVDLFVMAVGIYSIVLNVFSIMAAHRLSGGRATGVVLIPIAVAIVLVGACVCALVVVTLSAIH
jgi:hypothetical protein